VIGPVDAKFTQMTVQLVSEGSSGSVLPGRSTFLGANSHTKSKETPFVSEGRLLMECIRN